MPGFQLGQSEDFSRRHTYRPRDTVTPIFSYADFTLWDNQFSIESEIKRRRLATQDSQAAFNHERNAKHGKQRTVSTAL